MAAMAPAPGEILMAQEAANKASQVENSIASALRVLQGRDTLFDRWVRRKQLANAASNTERRHTLGQLAGVHAAQARQGIDHGLAAAQQLGRARISPEFTVAREPGHHDGGGKSEHDV